MSGLLSRIVPRRAAPQALSLPDPAAAEGEARPPAGVDPSEPRRRAPGARERSAMRRRLRHLERAREVHLRDLGGLAFDIHRFGARAEPAARARHAELVRGKVAELEGLDRELRGLREALELGTGVRELREAGIGGACTRCGALHGSEARYCSACGASLGASTSNGAGPE
jgi:hypothetical protein